MQPQCFVVVVAFNFWNNSGNILGLGLPQMLLVFRGLERLTYLSEGYFIIYAVCIAGHLFRLFSFFFLLIIEKNKQVPLEVRILRESESIRPGDANLFLPCWVGGSHLGHQRTWGFMASVGYMGMMERVGKRNKHIILLSDWYAPHALHIAEWQKAAV